MNTGNSTQEDPRLHELGYEEELSWKCQTLDEKKLYYELQNNEQLFYSRRKFLRCAGYQNPNAMPLSENVFREVVNRFRIPEEFLEGHTIFLYDESRQSFILKTPRLGGRQVAIALCWDSGKVRYIVQGLSSQEFQNMVQRRQDISTELGDIMNGVLKLLLDTATSHIKASTETLQKYQSDIETISQQIQDSKYTSSSVFTALNKAKASLEMARSSTEYIKHVLERHPSAYAFPMDATRRTFLLALSDGRIDEIESSAREIGDALNMLVFGSMIGSRRDSANQSLTSLLTFFLLPATFTAVFFTLPIFNWENDTDPFLKSQHFWYYWATTGSLSGLLFVIYFGYPFVRDFVLWIKRIIGERRDKNKRALAEQRKHMFEQSLNIV